MIASVVPALAAVTNLPVDQVDMELSEAIAGLTEENKGRLDTRVFVDALSAFRQAHPFSLSDLQAAQVARKELDARSTGAA